MSEVSVEDIRAFHAEASYILSKLTAAEGEELEFDRRDARDHDAATLSSSFRQAPGLHQKLQHVPRDSRSHAREA
eukprot:833737-Amphidinium_carterae.1